MCILQGLINKYAQHGMEDSANLKGIIFNKYFDALTGNCP